MSAPETMQILIGMTQQVWDATFCNKLIKALPSAVQAEVEALQRWEDRQASVLGKCLLIHGLCLLQRDPKSVYTLKRDEYQRPFIEGGIDFNISHSKGLVACALQIGGRVGVDVEAIEPLNVEDHILVFTAQEQLSILKNNNSLKEFFNLWTRKEAVLKADGRGFLIDPQQIEIQFPAVSIDGFCFNIHGFELPDPFVGHLATTHTGSVELHWPSNEALLQTVRLLPDSNRN